MTYEKYCLPLPKIERLIARQKHSQTHADINTGTAYSHIIRNMLKKAPILWFVLPMMAGIWMAEHLGGEVWRLATISFILFAACIATIRNSRLFFPVFLATAMVFGHTWTLVKMPKQEIPFGQTTCELTVVSYPEEKNKTMKVTATIDRYVDTGGYWIGSHNKAVVYIAKDTLSKNLQPGDRIHALLNLEQPFEGYDPEAFNYRKFLKRKGILYQSYLPSHHYHLMEQENKRQKQMWTHRQQEKMVGIIDRSNLSKPHKGLAKALCLGYKHDIDQITHQQFKVAGITHLLCVSGLHVGIFATLIGYLLFFLGKERKQAIIKCIVKTIAIWSFVMITGMAPASVRAGLMFTILILGSTFFQKPNHFNAIATAALIMLLINPMNLFDVGFQLSFAAVVGITSIGNSMRRLMPHRNNGIIHRFLHWVWGLFCVTTSAQLATLPFILYYFHQFPLYFMLANMTIVPCAGIMLGCIILMIATSSWPWAYQHIANLLSVVFDTVDIITSWIATLPHALVDNISFRAIQAVMLTAAIIIIGILLDRTSRLRTAKAVGAKPRRSPPFDI